MAQFDWVDFYKEFAYKLLAYDKNRPELIKIIKNIYAEIDINLPTLEKDNQIIDIDPFTVFALFNKNSMKETNRIKIITAFASRFGMKANVPTSFEGIPVLNNQNAIFYSFFDTRGDGDIDNLWSLFKNALSYADDSTPNNKKKVSKYFDLVIQCKGNGNSKVTMGIYWISPDTFLNLDSRNKWYIYKSGEIPQEVVGRLPQVEKNIKAVKYFEIVEDLREFLSKRNSILKDFKELSYEAWRHSEEVNQGDEAYSQKDNKISKASFLRWMKPLLQALRDLGGSGNPQDVRKKIIENENLRRDEVSEKRGKNNVNKFENEVAFARNYLVYGGYIDKSVHGVWILTEEGKNVAMTDELASAIFSKWGKVKPSKKNDGEIDEHLESPTFWKISHGTNCISDSEFKTFLDKKIIVVNEDTKAKAQSKTAQGKSFMQNMKKGDFFYLCRGNSIRLFCKVESDLAVLNEEKKDGWHQRVYSIIAESKDKSAYKGIQKWWTPDDNSTCMPIKQSDIPLFEEYILLPYFELTVNTLLGIKDKEQVMKNYDEYFKKDFLGEVYMKENRYDMLATLLKNKKNIILQGAPGVGKTFAAKRLAYSLMGEKNDNRIELVQFHQNYSYEDFMMGYKPSGDGFELKNGIFYNFCKKAESAPDNDHFFIIDEINRGNMSKIFGELLMLIEKDYRGTKATLAYNGLPFSVPKNIYIIGMMNTADRSLAMIDYALRRRFSFFDMEPGFDSEVFIKYKNSLNSETIIALISKICDLNKEITNDKSLGKGFCIGHSYFSNIDGCTDGLLQSIVEFDILPMLSEYWFDEETKLKSWENELRGVFR